MSVLKWVGGKNQIMSNIQKKIPHDIDIYYELFVGGGSVFITLLKNNNSTYNIKKFIINDKNKYLINMYKVILNNHLDLISELEKLENNLSNFNEVKYKPRENIIPSDNFDEIKSKKEYYYFIRKKFNKKKNNTNDNNNLIKISSYFIFLNKVGFRGLYRENKNGNFNVPYGNYKNPNIVNKNNILELNKLFTTNNIEFLNKDFNDVIQETDEYNNKNNNILFYLDPPYYPINKTSFTSYNGVDFIKEDHKKFILFLKKLNKDGKKFLMSNSHTSFILKNINEYNYEKILCKRRINSKTPQDTEYEILCYNY